MRERMKVDIKRWVVRLQVRVFMRVVGRESGAIVVLGYVFVVFILWKKKDRKG